MALIDIARPFPTENAAAIVAAYFPRERNAAHQRSPALSFITSRTGLST